MALRQTSVRIRRWKTPGGNMMVKFPPFHGEISISAQEISVGTACNKVVSSIINHHLYKKACNRLQKKSSAYLLAWVAVGMLHVPFSGSAGLFVGAQSTGKRTTSIKQITDKLLKDYDRETLPPGKTEVRNDMWIQEFNSICELKQELSLYLYFNQRWLDTRLNFQRLTNKDKITLSAAVQKKLWEPEVSFVNREVVRASGGPTPTVFTLVFNNGTVHLNNRLKVSAPCQIRSLACDKPVCQKAECSMVFQSYRYAKGEIKMLMGKNDVRMLKETAEVPGGWKLKGFNVKVKEEKYSAGKWEDVAVTLTFVRM